MRLNPFLIFLIVLLLVFIMSLIVNLTYEGFQTNKINKMNKMNKTQKTDYKIIMFLTSGLCEEAENCIQSLKNMNLNNKVIVTALDDKAYEHMKRCGVTTERRKTNLKPEADFGTKDFYEIVYNKLEIIENNLKKNDEIIVYSDTDIVFLNDISEDIDKFKQSDYDIMFQNDVRHFDDSKKDNLCTGFIFFKPNQSCFKLLKDSKKIMKNNWDNKKWHKGTADQNALNEAIKLNKNLNIGVLDLKEYPNGSRYFNNLNTIYKNTTPKIVHNNYIVGTKNKIERFKMNNLWFI